MIIIFKNFRSASVLNSLFESFNGLLMTRNGNVIMVNITKTVENKGRMTVELNNSGREELLNSQWESLKSFWIKCPVGKGAGFSVVLLSIDYFFGGNWNFIMATFIYKFIIIYYLFMNIVFCLIIFYVVLKRVIVLNYRLFVYL